MKPTTQDLRDLFPKTKPYRSGYLKVSKLHTIHFEEHGNSRGKPLVFLHGGPGGRIEPYYHRYFDPKRWRVVLHNQRGCGKSTPSRSSGRTRGGISWRTSRSCASISPSTGARLRWDLG
jgi:proline iminopeptidase